MFVLYGTVVGVVDKVLDNADKTKIRTVQVLANGGKYKAILDIVDWDMREWREGDALEIPVSIKANVAKDGKKAFLNYTALPSE